MEALGLSFLLIFIPLYLIPLGVASHREHPQLLAIAALNVLFGWTFLGWGLALVWALTAIPEERRGGHHA